MKEFGSKKNPYNLIHRIFIIFDILQSSPFEKSYWFTKMRSRLPQIPIPLREVILIFCVSLHNVMFRRSKMAFYDNFLFVQKNNGNSNVLILFQINIWHETLAETE